MAIHINPRRAVGAEGSRLPTHLALRVDGEGEAASQNLVAEEVHHAVNLKHVLRVGGHGEPDEDGVAVGHALHGNAVVLAHRGTPTWLGVGEERRGLAIYGLAEDDLGNTWRSNSVHVW